MAAHPSTQTGTGTSTETGADFRARIAQEATNALLDYQPQTLVKMLAHYDALMVAFKDWQLVSMLDLSTTSPVPAKDPFAWLLFQHRIHGWWAAYDTDAECLSHPFTGPYIHTHLVHPARLTVGYTPDQICEAAFKLATEPQHRNGAMEAPTTRDTVHGRWVLGHFTTDTSAAYQMLLDLGAGH